MLTDIDKHQSEMCLSLFRMSKRHSREMHCSIGRRILKSNHFNDVYCSMESEERCVLYLIDTKQLSCNTTMFGSESALIKYFKAYLKLRKQAAHFIKEVAVWTRMNADWEKNPASKTQLDRYRIRLGVSTEKQLIMLCHPLYQLASKIAHTMFKKSVISPSRISKRFFMILLKDVFKDQNHFKDDFLQCSEDLCWEAKQFYGYLEHVLIEKYRQRNIMGFYKLLQIEQMPYAKFIELQVVDSEWNDEYISKSAWNVVNHVSHEDVQQFLSTFALYTNIPMGNQINILLPRYYNLRTKNMMENIYASGVLVRSADIDDLWALMNTERYEDVYCFENLLFKPDTLKDLAKVLLTYVVYKKSYNKIIIEACNDVHISVSRVIRILEKSTNRYICVNGTQFMERQKNISHLIQILLKYHLDWWIVLVIEENFSAFDDFWKQDYRMIIIVAESNNFHNQSAFAYKDRFVYSDLVDSAKDKILSTPVILQGRQSKLGTLLSENALAMIPISALGYLSRNYHQNIVIGKQLDVLELKLFIPRYCRTNSHFKINPFETDLSSISILCGLPGIGKSQLLMRLAIHFSKQFNDSVVLLVDFKRIVDWLDDSFNITTLVLRLMNLSCIDNIQKFIVQRIVADEKVILLLDGFDEVCLLKMEHANRIINLFSKSNHRLIIATRPHRLDVLQQYLNDSIVYNILPFTEDEQLQFLEQRLSNVLSNEWQCTDLIETVKTVFNGENPLGIPRQIEIIASMYDNVKSTNLFSLRNAAEVLQIFVDKWIDIYFEIFFDRHDESHDSIIETLRFNFECDHSEIAFRLATNQTIRPTVFSNAVQYGLLRIDNGKVSFRISSLTSFFSAQYVIRHQIGQHQFNRYMLEHFCRPNDRFDIYLEHHLSKTDFHRKPLGTMPAIQNINLSELRILQNHRIHADKIKQLHLFLVECSSVEQQLGYIRKAIGNAHLFTFQVLYESLPKSLIQEQRFKFTSDKVDPFKIDISGVSEEYLVLLLKILYQEHSNDFVTKIMSNFERNEDDFVSAAIKRDYRGLIEEMFHIEQDLTNEEESDLMQEYLSSRWSHYLRLAVEHRRNALLNLVLGFIETRFHSRVIKRFLINSNILRVLFETCNSEQVDVSVMKRVLDFIEQHLSKYDLKTLLNRSVDGWIFIERIKTLQNPRACELCESLLKCYGTFQR
ncbi:uncharacterized protein LOC134219420 isoform X2 [Armigeres subalbatus]|uniref:uncharacterized protein LOC134219420 isoform X2 n=1 Tax=Armigeres subalbatus TaxID=124917 RepID=UPI002ED0D112